MKKFILPILIVLMFIGTATAVTLSVPTKPEDSPSVNYEAGMVVFGVKNAANTATSATDGDHESFHMDPTGSLKVNATSIMAGTNNIGLVDIGSSEFVPVSLVETSAVNDAHNITIAHTDAKRIHIRKYIIGWNGTVNALGGFVQIAPATGAIYWRDFVKGGALINESLDSGVVDITTPAVATDMVIMLPAMNTYVTGTASISYTVE